MRIEFQPFGFNGFMTGGAYPIGDIRPGVEGLINLAYFIVIPVRKTVEKPEPILIGAMIHPLGILLDRLSFPLQMLQGHLNAFAPLPKPIGTGKNL
jgi:hypothetical protein